MTVTGWIANNWIEIFGAVTGIIYVFLEIRQISWLWPVGIVTSAVYIVVFFTSKFYADMSLQGYYLVISVLGWYWWVKGTGRRVKSGELGAGGGDIKLKVTRLGFKTGVVLAVIFIIIYFIIWLVLSKMTDSPVPAGDAFITSLSIIATWMLARKKYEHWFLWIVVNSVSSALFIIKDLYPTVVLYLIYLVMSFAGLREWRKSLNK
ncbi:MAG: nicotinamide riboside transporter PnuC, partial [Bacteroidota bacterium]|nr:nicotinamide riboside transporter PnuC [Bacteroidota bacterium]